MKAGEAIRESFKLYLENPAIIAPYFLFGFFNTLLISFIVEYVRASLTLLRNATPLELLIYGATAKSAISVIILKNAFFLIAMALFYAIVDAFVKAYTIGISEKISRTGTAKLADGISASRRIFSIVGKDIIMAFLLVFGFLLIFFTSVVLFSKYALITFFPAAIIYAFVLFFVTFFANQSIVIEKKGPWSGIVSGYHFIKKHIEDIAKLMLFLIFVFVAFQIVRLATLRTLEHFFTGYTLAIISFAENLLLGYLIMRPYFVVLRTHYFVKNHKPIKQQK